MNDELMTLIDTRGRAAGSAVQHAATTRSWTTAAPKRPVVWLRPALVMATLVAVIAGLVWVTGRPTEPADRRDPSDLRYVIGDVPAGWTAPEAQDADEGPFNDPSNVRISLFGTRGDPLSPMLQLAWQDPAQESAVSLGGLMSLAAYGNLREIDAGGAPAACGDEASSVRCVMNTARGPIQSTSFGLSDAELGRLLSAVELVGGETMIDPVVLADGMTLISQGGLGEHQPALWSPLHAKGASQVVYRPNADDGLLSLAVGWTDENDLAGLAAWGDMQRIEMNGRPAYVASGESIGAIGLFWVDGVRTFALVASEPSLDLVAIAASVRPATDGEWAAIIVEQPSDADPMTPPDGTFPAVPETTVLGEAPSDTEPPVSVPTLVDLRDVVVAQVVLPINDFDAAYSATLSDGVFGEVQIAVVAGTVVARGSTGNSGAISGDLTGAAPTNLNTLDLNGNVGAIAWSTDPTAAQLRVTRQNGDRYLLDLVPVQSHPELRVGVIVLPPASFVTFDVVDVDGKVLISYGTA